MTLQSQPASDLITNKACGVMRYHVISLRQSWDMVGVTSTRPRISIEFINQSHQIKGVASIDPDDNQTQLKPFVY